MKVLVASLSMVAALWPTNAPAGLSVPGGRTSSSS
jgi:hypothetical protein